MQFSANSCGAGIAALFGQGLRPMPLVTDGKEQAEAREAIANSNVPPAAKAGLWLYFGYFDEAHTTAQSVETPDGNYWHAIVHRMEPDAANAGYWFRRVGSHPIFPELRRQAAELGFYSSPDWKPMRFVEACTEGKDVSLLQAVQLAEWQLLMAHCLEAGA